MARKARNATIAGESMVQDGGAHYASSLRALLGKQGRLVIPAEIRESMGLKPGDPLTMRLENGKLIIENPDSVLRRLQERFRSAPNEPSVVDELIQERRESARREAEE